VSHIEHSPCSSARIPTGLPGTWLRAQQMGIFDPDHQELISLEGSQSMKPPVMATTGRTAPCVSAADGAHVCGLVVVIA